MAEDREKLWVLMNRIRKFLVLLRWGVSWQYEYQLASVEELDSMEFVG